MFYSVFVSIFGDPEDVDPLKKKPRLQLSLPNADASVADEGEGTLVINTSEPQQVRVVSL